MKYNYRPYQTEEDYRRMREFLRQVFILNGRLQISWHVARLDYARWHVFINCHEVRMEEMVYLWEANDRLLGFCISEEGKGDAHMCVHPELRIPELEIEMLNVAEKHLARIKEDGKRCLHVWAPERDKIRQEILLKSGYVRADRIEHQWRYSFKAPIPDVPVPPGYAIRTVEHGAELGARCYASGLAFHNGDVEIARRNREDVSYYRNIQSAPLYSRDLDLALVTPEGEVASFCTIWYDQATESAYFEPVGTVPAHQRKGLSKALMTEGLRRLKKIGATTAFVGGFSRPANALYKKVMGTDYELYQAWEKR
jgi:GNAT superfamily N-acetyltransferase